MRIILALILCLAFSWGCGVGNGAASVNDPAPPSLSGNWEIGNGTEVFEAYFTQAGTAVTGSLLGYTCNPTASTAIPITGTLTTQNQLTLSGKTTIPSSGTFSLTGALSSATALQGTVMYAAPGCNSNQGFSVAGQQYPALSGSWTVIQAVNVSGQQVTVTLGTATLTETATSQFPSLSGTVTFSNSPCFTAGTLTGSQEGRYLSAFSAIVTNNGVISVGAAAFNSSGQLFIDSYSVSGSSIGTCNGTGQVTLTQQ